MLIKDQKVLLKGIYWRNDNNQHCPKTSTTNVSNQDHNYTVNVNNDVKKLGKFSVENPNSHSWSIITPCLVHDARGDESSGRPLTASGILLVLELAEVMWCGHQPELPPHHGKQQVPSLAWLTSPTNMRGSHHLWVGLTERSKGEKTQEELRSWQ